MRSQGRVHMVITQTTKNNEYEYYCPHCAIIFPAGTDFVYVRSDEWEDYFDKFTAKAIAERGCWICESCAIHYGVIW